MLSIPSLYERNQEATVYSGNLDQKVSESLLWELFIQCGPVVNVHIPRDKITNDHQGFGFVEFKSEEDADYAIKIMHMIKLFGKPIKVNKASQDKRVQDVGANLFVGNLDPEVDERQLFETFSNFGTIISTKISRDTADASSNGHGFVSFDNFQSSDLSIAQMNGQYFAGRQIRVDYAIKKDTKKQKHGSEAERILAENRPTPLNKVSNLFLNPLDPKVPKANFIKPGESSLAKGTISTSLLMPPKPTFGKLMPDIKLPPMPHPSMPPPPMPPK